MHNATIKKCTNNCVLKAGINCILTTRGLLCCVFSHVQWSDSNRKWQHRLEHRPKVNVTKIKPLTWTNIGCCVSLIYSLSIHEPNLIPTNSLYTLYPNSEWAASCSPCNILLLVNAEQLCRRSALPLGCSSPPPPQTRHMFCRHQLRLLSCSLHGIMKPRESGHWIYKNTAVTFPTRQDKAMLAVSCYSE